jgi:hypothetical protein
MLPIPENDWSQPQVLASWLELCALAEDDGAALRGAALEALRDSQLFTDGANAGQGAQDSSAAGSAAGTLAEAWRVLRAREQLLGEAWPLRLSEEILTRKVGRTTLASVAAYTTMLLIEAASSKWYESAAIHAGDAVREWFEHIAVASVGRFAAGRAVRFGAPFPSGWPKTFHRRVKHLAGIFEIDARDAELKKFSSPEQKDDSLDVVARIKFLDEQGGLPYVLVQCATGANWATHKAGQPTISLWENYIGWDGPRLKALAVPFALRGVGQMHNASVRHHNAVVFDRLRLAGALPDDFIDSALRTKLVKWCRGKFVALAKGPLSSAPTHRRRRRGR